MDNPKGSPVKILYNQDVSLSISRLNATMPFFFRNADGDELNFIHKGEGRFESVFGAMLFEVGDYILIPKGTNYRFVYNTSENFSLIIESRYAIGFPDRGIIGHHAPFDYSMLETPEPDPVYESDQDEWELKIKNVINLRPSFTHFVQWMLWAGQAHSQF